MASAAYIQGTIDSRARYVAISFQCDDVISLQFDWTFLILGNRAKYLNLVHQTVSRACRYELGTRLRETYQRAGCIKGHENFEGSRHQQSRAKVQTLAAECSTILIDYRE